PDAPRPPMIQHSLLNTIFSGISPLPKVSAGSRYAPTQSVGRKKKLPCPSVCSVGKTSWLSLKMKQHVGLKFSLSA
ncbi:hypothetical protein, partial [Desulfonatronospira sp.]|uniref:hypothetical protein n=1 Tax=Desulfonatronospira sp. TaxID=1962951 RepID=UPI0025BFB148